MICPAFPTCVKSALTSSTPCSNLELCFQIKSGPIISCGERKEVYRINNTGRWKCAQYHIDNKRIFAESEKKCDFLFIIEDNKEIPHYVFVELKGIDVGSGLAQLKSTIMASNLAKARHVSARLVARSAPNLSMSKPSSKAVLKWFAENGVDYKTFTKCGSEDAHSLQ